MNPDPGRPDLLAVGSERERRRLPRPLRLAGVLAVAAAVAVAAVRSGDPPARPVVLPPPPSPVAVASLYVSSCRPDRVYRVTDSGALAPLGGTPGRGSDVRDGGPVAGGDISCPDGLLFDAGGLVHVVGPDAARLRVVGDGGVVRSVAGDVVDPRRALGLHALLQSPDAVGVGRDGTLYVGSLSGSRVRRLSADGRIGPLSPDAPPPAPADDPARSALLAVDDDLSTLFADGDSDRVFRVDAGGRVTTAAGTGATVSGGDGGPAPAAAVPNPRAVALDPQGRLYVTEGAGRLVRRIALDGTISTFAGTGAVGSGGDGGPATAATFTSPGDLAVSGSGSVSVYVVDLGAGAVRRITPDGQIQTLGS